MYKGVSQTECVLFKPSIADRTTMGLLSTIGNVWQARWEMKNNAHVASLDINDRILTVKLKISNRGEVFVVLKRAGAQGRLTEMKKTYKTVFAARQLCSLKVSYFTNHLKDVLFHCKHLQDLELTEAEINEELAQVILQSPLTKACSFIRCDFKAEALDRFFHVFFSRTLQHNFLADLNEASEADRKPLEVTEFNVQSFPGKKSMIHFHVCITDGKRRGVSKLSFVNCTIAKRMTIFKCLSTDPVKALQQVVQNIKHVLSSGTAWDDFKSDWDMSPVEAVSNPFDSYSNNGSFDSSISEELM